MPRADVAVIGAGLAGLTAAISLADANAQVLVLATGHAATHWAPGGIDAGALPGTRTPAEAVARLSEVPGHPYQFLAPVLPDALGWLRDLLSAEGLEYVGTLQDPIRPVPTAVGSTRPAAILPSGMAAALREWEPGERLVICGPAGFRDFWPEAIAGSLERAESWRGSAPPGRIESLRVDLPGLSGRHNLSSLDIARAFDDAPWRDRALDIIARAVDRLGSGAGRIGLPAVLGLNDHAAVLAEARSRLPLTPFEIPLAPPSVPGLRLYRALRSALLQRGGRIQVGEAVHGTIEPGGRVARVSAPAAARSFVVAVNGLVLATGGIAGGGIVAGEDGTLAETVLGLPVEGPPADTWLLADPFDDAGHALEKAGIRTDRTLRPLRPAADGGGSPLAENVRIAGSLLAGQRYLREHCGDGVAIASGRLAALGLAGDRSARATQPAVGAAPMAGVP
jgi:glycerol-3-phosphate dehydrogenase subunit B